MKNSDIKTEINFQHHQKISSKNQDEINLELSKTYFGGGKNRRTVPDRRNTRNHREENANSIKKIHLAIIAILLSIITGLIFMFGSAFWDQNNENTLITGTAPVNITPSLMENPVSVIKPIPMVPPLKSETGKAVLYDFEENDDGWGIPAWALNLRDHAAISSHQSDKHSSEGNGSLKIDSKFPADQWSASLVEIQHFLNLENFDVIAVDVYFPGKSSKTLRGIIILTQGENWEFNEMSHSFRINPGEWTTIYADISENSVDWKKKKLDQYFRNDIRKIAVRIESTKTPYNGPVYVDNMRVLKKEYFHPDNLRRTEGVRP